MDTDELCCQRCEFKVQLSHFLVVTCSCDLPVCSLKSSTLSNHVHPQRANTWRMAKKSICKPEPHPYVHRLSSQLCHPSPELLHWPWNVCLLLLSTTHLPHLQIFVSFLSSKHYTLCLYHTQTCHSTGVQLKLPGTSRNLTVLSRIFNVFICSDDIMPVPARALWSTRYKY